MYRDRKPGWLLQKMRGEARAFVVSGKEWPPFQRWAAIFLQATDVFDAEAERAKIMHDFATINGNGHDPS